MQVQPFNYYYNINSVHTHLDQISAPDSSFFLKNFPCASIARPQHISPKERIGTGCSATLIYPLLACLLSASLLLSHACPPRPSACHVAISHGRGVAQSTLSRSRPLPPQASGALSILCQMLMRQCRASHTEAVSHLSCCKECVQRLSKAHPFLTSSHAQTILALVASAIQQ